MSGTITSGLTRRKTPRVRAALPIQERHFHKIGQLPIEIRRFIWDFYFAEYKGEPDVNILWPPPNLLAALRPDGSLLLEVANVFYGSFDFTLRVENHGGFVTLRKDVVSGIKSLHIRDSIYMRHLPMTVSSIDHGFHQFLTNPPSQLKYLTGLKKLKISTATGIPWFEPLIRRLGRRCVKLQNLEICLTHDKDAEKVAREMGRLVYKHMGIDLIQPEQDKVRSVWLWEKPKEILE